MTQYARNDQVRAHVFLNGVGTATPDPLYTPVLGMEAITQSLGDITDEEVPSATRYQEFDIVGGIPGKKERATTSLTTRKPVGQPSVLETIKDRGLNPDIHLNRGLCSAPSDPNQFAEKVILEGVRATNYSTSAFMALGSDTRESMTETLDVSMDNYYTIYQMQYGLAAAPVDETTTVPAYTAVGRGVVFLPTWCAGGNKCSSLFVASAANIWFVRGSNAAATNYSGSDIGGIGILGQSLLVAKNAVGLELIPFDATTLKTAYKTTRTISGVGATFSAVSTNDRGGIVASGLKVYTMNPTATTIVETDLTSVAGASAAAIADVHISADGAYFAAISDKGYVAFSEDGVSWRAATVCNGTTPVGSAIAVLSRDTWLAGLTDGTIQLTSDSGDTWTTVLDVTGTVHDLMVVTKHVVYASIGSTLYRSTDGGASWNVEPNVQGRNFVSMTSIGKMAVCPDDKNQIAIIGIKDTDLRLIKGIPGA